MVGLIAKVVYIFVGFEFRAFEVKPILSATKMYSHTNLFFGDILFMMIFSKITEKQ